jgi:hypothetical protein
MGKVQLKSKLAVGLYVRVINCALVLCWENRLQAFEFESLCWTGGSHLHFSGFDLLTLLIMLGADEFPLPVIW